MFADLPPSPVGPERTYQSLVEFSCLWDYCAQREPKKIVEIGSLYGGTLWYWLQIPGVVSVTSIDLVTDYAPIRDDVLAARETWPSWAGDKYHPPFLTIIDGNSQDENLAGYIAVGRPIDVLFIDGDHTADGVRADYETWSPYVRAGGIIAFHDTVINGTRHEPGVISLVSELKWRLPSIEFFDPDGAGITAFHHLVS